ncbi:endonuclease domain-containing protein [Pseudonocardia xinjiangensis]|uniref:endonuclease domain-containing protein n=1 Tax=Pseudonocardia xinjiangensis TaxID=75289 RepID=UPI003D8A38C6
MSLPDVFRGSAAVRAGLVTKAQLRGPRYLRIFPDIYTPVRAQPLDPVLRSRAAYLLGGGRGVVSGYSAAALLGASCGPQGAPAELTVPGGGPRSHPGLVLHRDRLARDEVQQCNGVLVTTPVRTAYDLARWQEPVEAVVAVDALANRGRFAPEQILRLAARYPRARGRSGLPRAVSLSDARAGSPMETRLRLVLVLRGLPVPEVQYPVLDDRVRRAVWLDMAYPEQRIGIEYEGADHGSPERVLRDVGRYTALVDQGWRMYRFAKYEVYGEPDEIAAKIRRALGA